MNKNVNITYNIGGEKFRISIHLFKKLSSNVKAT